VIYAVFPFVFLLFLLAQGRGLGMAIKSFAMALIWIQLWPPLYAILNYVATLASAKNLAAAAKMGSGAAGLALETASRVYNGAVSDQAIAGYMVISIPIIATAIIKGGEVAFAAVTGASSIQSAASSEGAQTSKGLISQGVVSTDQYTIDTAFKSPFMVRKTDERGDEHVQMLGTRAARNQHAAEFELFERSLHLDAVPGAFRGSRARIRGRPN
jgi:conjugal transfer mating pair stabilization protein TraG